MGYYQHKPFDASNGWLEGFKKRMGISYKASRGSSDAINKKEEYQKLDEIIRGNKLELYNADQIFNID